MTDPSKGFDLEQARRFAQSDAGKQLLGLLMNSRDPSVARAKEQVAQGDYSGASSQLQSLMNDPRVQQLLKEMGNKNG